MACMKKAYLPSHRSWYNEEQILGNSCDQRPIQTGRNTFKLLKNLDEKTSLLFLIVIKRGKLHFLPLIFGRVDVGCADDHTRLVDIS